MDKLRLFLVLSVFPLLVAACGGGSSSSSQTASQPVTISLSELSATVEISATHQFNSTVENADDTSVDWKVNKVSGGNSTAGTISDSGLYTAPDHVPSPETVTVTAVSHADATKEASATVTVMSNVTMSVSPLSATVEIGKTQQFTATVQNAKDKAVDWRVNNVTGGNSTLGTISESGLYTAPSQVPLPSTVAITAVSRADAAKSATASVTVTPGVTISVSPTSATVEISNTHQFSATVQNASDTTVEWQVNGVSGGNTTVGTISASGLYTAPDHVPSPSTVTVTAVSHQEPTSTASATVTIMSNVTVSVSPLSVTVEIGKTQQFAATVQNAKDKAVDWQVNNVTGGNSTVGTISASGLYTAPDHAPSPSTVKVTAVSVADPGKTASAAVTVTANITISVSPLSATVEIGKTYQFSATVGNTDDDSVDWQVDNVSGGNSSVGTISASGLYTAPDRVPSVSTVTIKAVANADPTKEASASVTIMSNVTVSISPTDAAIPAGQTQQFTATVQNAVDTTIIWQVNDVKGGNDKLGTITSAGLYTAPSLPPAGGAVTITAISAADTSKTAAVSATIQFSNASLSGPYVFSMSGNIPTMGPYYAAGRFVADGKGNVANFVQDFRQGGVSSQMLSSGTYTVRPDGRGSLTLSFEGQSEPSTVMFELTSNGEGPVIQFMNTSTGSGRFYKQDSNAFSNASMKGSYVMQMLGAESSGKTVAGVGMMTIDGAGNLTGMQDVNTGKELLAKMPVNGNYSVDANGRAVVTTVAGSDTDQTAMYLISSDRAVGVPLGSGSGGGLIWIEKQQITNFSNASVSGGYVYFANGDPAVEGDFALGWISANGEGEITGGIEDNNYHGSVTQAVPLTGSYSIPPTDLGRGTVTITTPQGTGGAIVYLVSEKKAFLLGTDTSEPTGGQIIATQGEPFSVSSLQGNFVFSLRGFNAFLTVDILGHLTLDGNGTLTGTQGVNIGGLLVPNVPISGTYFVTPIGRGNLMDSDGTTQLSFSLYVVDSSHAYLIGTDAGGPVLFGSMEAQF